MVYTGTLSERFDAPLLMEVLRRLPDWSAELYGECQYAGQGSAPGSELRAALAAFKGRVRWHGPIKRADLADVLDRGRVLIAPHRALYATGQDSMKLYDYAARGRPIVATLGALGDRARVAKAGVLEAASPADFAAAVLDAAGEDLSNAAGRRAWAERNSWESRWPLWASAAFGGRSVAEDAKLCRSCERA